MKVLSFSSDWAARLSSKINFCMFSFIPMHVVLTQRESRTLAVITCGLLVVVAALSLVTGNRQPFRLALIAAMLNIVFVK